MDLITLRDIRKTYKLGQVDLPVLKGVSLEIGRGEMVALMGASGSGKTTLMNTLGCLDRPTSGEYWLDGQEVSRLSNDDRAVVRNRKIGFVFQSFNLLPRTTARQNVELPLVYGTAPIAEHRGRAEAALRAVGLGDAAGRLPNELSGGQQQRVAIARALVNRPRLVLADEPTGNLDTETSREIMELLRSLNASQGLTVMIVTHEPDIANYSNRIIRFKDGHLVSDELVAQPRDAQRELETLPAEEPEPEEAVA